MISTSKRHHRKLRGPALIAAAAFGVLMVAPTQGTASTKFGAKLNPTIQPSNSLPAHPCQHQDPGKPCTWVENEARYNVGGERAPKSGTIKRIRLVAGGPGHFRLQIAKVDRSTLNDTNEAKVVRNGPSITYQGQSQSNFDSGVYKVESFPVSVPIKKGQYLAIKAAYSSMLYCAGGDNNILLYEPPLLAGGGFTPAKSTDGCDLLLEAVIK